MILCIVAIMLGQVNGARSLATGIGADMIVQPPNSTFLSGISGAPVPAKIADVLRKVPHVAVAAPVIVNLTAGASLETIWGIDYASFNALRPFVFISGTPFQGPNDVIVDDYFARSDKGHHVGEMITILTHEFRICGIVEHGKGGRKFLQIRTLGGLMDNPDNASLFYLRSDDPNNEDLIRKEIVATPGLSDYQVKTMAEQLSMLTPEHLPAFTIALDVVIGIAVIIGFLVIFQSMYTAVMERTREIGVLKSLGASKGYIVNVVLRETALISICGIALGMLLTQLIKTWMSYRFPTLPFFVTADWWLRGTLIAFAGGILGAIYPALKAASKDPIDALAYE
ncbi:ABC-type transporter [Acidisarcina polymorpha]|uniref:ABC-type transporter n=2 Tax=Acidisarcina polymorpha TaxID=2211140 RepID=A0A2Z5G2U4_9BACT|nr:ABC-type transporter [Acidisarcina polymorpha]